MTKNGRYNVSHKEELLIQALLQTKSVKDASEVSGLGETTIYRYLKRESFLQKYRDSREQLIKSLVQRLQSASHKALDELLHIIEDKYAKEHNKVQACKVILETAIRSTEIQKLEQIEDRLSELESNKGLRHVN